MKYLFRECDVAYTEFGQERSFLQSGALCFHALQTSTRFALGIGGRKREGRNLARNQDVRLPLGKYWSSFRKSYETHSICWTSHIPCHAQQTFMKEDTFQRQKATFHSMKDHVSECNVVYTVFGQYRSCFSQESRTLPGRAETQQEINVFGSCLANLGPPSNSHLKHLICCTSDIPVIAPTRHMQCTTDLFHA